MARLCHPEHETPRVVENTLDIRLGGDAPQLIVNGVDIAPMVKADWTLDVAHRENQAYLTVTYPVMLP